ncbi:MAG: RsmD family RNA methyltransferase [Varibaculum sp.]|nr:RsmD family RNA methyltransferase [Varibaculum sp.]
MLDSASTDALTEEIELIDYAYGGYAVGRGASGRVLFVRGGVPGERVRIRITTQRSRLAYGDVVEVLRASKYRVPHVWDEPVGYYAADLGHIDLKYQRELKRQALLDGARRLGSPLLAERLAEVLDTVSFGDRELGYRLRTRVIALGDGRVGMHIGHSEQVVALTRLPLVHEDIQDLDFSALPAAAGQEIVLARGEDAQGAQVRAVIGGQAYQADAVKAQDPWITYRVAGGSSGSEWRADFRAAAGGFWQAHRHAAAALSDAVRLPERARTLELYSGSGLLTAAIARCGAIPLACVETDRLAVRAAKYNLRALPEGLSHDVRLLHARVTPHTILEAGEVDAIVADPPRAGLGRANVEAINASNARYLHAMFCDQASALRDLQHLLNLGWNLKEAVFYDLFPHTHHLEVVARLVRDL